MLEDIVSSLLSVVGQREVPMFSRRLAGPQVEGVEAIHIEVATSPMGKFNEAAATVHLDEGGCFASQSTNERSGV